ncbi:replication/maintenance protein RepL [Clostridium tarantellae]|uniref:Plasmid replication protein RepL domain-containing protein n=1 Tax=Clostridium tarantellae TaxID=39493 RepID=A0A6I1MS20_9CLOT|nr:replication/maintenance protein RepL [Clostridium tarantellae]MPQ44992.1 hypothetical protein [Clostridium tarantellae]
MGKKKIVNTETEFKYTINELGEIIDEENSLKTKVSFSETEPKYVKLYIDDISLLQGLTNNQNNILYNILKLTQFSTNEVILNKYYREKIAKNLNTNDQVIRNAISKLVKKEILFKVATGVYKLNPYLFGSGTWQNIKGLRMTIEYTNEGKKIQIKEIEQNKS